MEDKELTREETSVNDETSSNENKFLKVLKMIGHYLKDVFLNFKESFKYNNMKLPALLISIPGLLLGFFLNFHYYVVVQLTFPDSFDFSAIVLFALMLIGILNIFSAVSMSGKKNKKSVILATVMSAFIVIFGLLYLYEIIYFISLVYSGELAFSDFSIDLNYKMAFISVIGSIISTVAGCVLGWLRYDRNYVEVDR